MKVLKGCAWVLFAGAALAIILIVAVIIANLYNLGKSVSDDHATQTSVARSILTRTAAAESTPTPPAR